MSQRKVPELSLLSYVHGSENDKNIFFPKPLKLTPAKFDKKLKKERIQNFALLPAKRSIGKRAKARV